MQSGGFSLSRGAACVLLAGALAACDAPTGPGDRTSAAAAGPSMLITPACAGTGGQTHAEDTVTTAQTWSRANSPHRVTKRIVVATGGRITVAPGAAVCFSGNTGLIVRGGLVYARGRDTAQIVFTASDPAAGWQGMQFYASPGGSSYLTNVRIEHVEVNSGAVYGNPDHPVYIDSAVIRQVGWGVSLWGAGSRLSRSRVDTTTNRNGVAVSLGTGARFEKTVVRRAAGVGVQVVGAGVMLLGGRIEGSGGIGLYYMNDVAPSTYFTPIRVVGGRSYGFFGPASALARTYGTPALQDSLLGNARDTLVLHGGVLRNVLTLGPRAPVLVTSTVAVDSGGSFTAQPGARVAFAQYVQVRAGNGGRIYARGSAASPVLLTADDPAVGWGGLFMEGERTTTSYVTNTRIEHVSRIGIAVNATGLHRVLVDSAVIRMSGRAALLMSPNSRLMRTRVDTTLDASHSAVELGSNARLESTLIRASANFGVLVQSPSVVIASCEVRDGDRDGIYLLHPVAVHNCNLVNNVGVGIKAVSSAATDLRNNWWGSTGGPDGAGGDGAEGWITVNPWLTTPFVLPYVP
jgi:hypothetical protein